MDKVKIYLAVLRKHHFWVLCGSVVFVGVLFWSIAVADLAGRTKSRKDSIESKRGNLLNLTRPPSKLVNPSTITNTQLQTVQVTKQGHEAWKFLHGFQTEQNKWPPKLGDYFLRTVESLKPGEEIPSDCRELYQVFIRGHFFDLLKIPPVRLPLALDERGKKKLDANGQPIPLLPFETENAQRALAEQPGASTNLIYEGIVTWKSEDLKRFYDKFRFPTTPSSQVVWMFQEDLWVYEALLRVIRDTNANCSAFYLAPIKRIETLRIGQEAARTASERFLSLPSAGASMMGGAEGGPVSGPMPAADMSGPGAMGGEGMAPVGANPLDFRYVDKDGKPLKASDPKPFAEFNMMPVHMVLWVDQSKVPQLLVNLANASMPVEITRVCLNPGKGAKIDFSQFARAAAGPGVAPGSPGMPSVAGGFGEQEGFAPMATGVEGPGMAGPGMEGTGRAGEEYSDRDIPVEIEGVIYIFNIPDLAKFGTGAAGTESAEAAPAAAPAPGTPAPAAPAPGTPAPAPGTSAPAAPAPVAPAPGAPAAPAAPAAVPTPAGTTPGGAGQAVPPAASEATGTPVAPAAGQAAPAAAAGAPPAPAAAPKAAGP